MKKVLSLMVCASMVLPVTTQVSNIHAQTTKKNVVNTRKGKKTKVVKNPAYNQKIKAGGLVVNKDEVHLTKKAKYTLSLTGAVGATTWTSTKPSVATVSKTGKVTAKKNGVTEIIAQNNGNTAFTTVFVESAKIAQTSVKLVPGTSRTLSVQGVMGKVSKWTTSNKRVAKVGKKSGLVTALKKGSVTISAKVGKKTYKRKVTVTKAKATLSDPQLIMKKGAKKTLKVKNLYGKVKWSSSKKSVVSVSSKGKIKAKKGGKAVIKAKVGKKTLKSTVIVRDRVGLDATYIGVNMKTKGDVKVLNNKAKETVKYQSLNTAVVIVSSKGILTGVNPGMTRVLVTIPNKTFGDLRMYTVVQVVDPMTLPYSNVNSLVNDQIGMSVLNNLNDDEVNWSSSNSTIASVNGDGLVSCRKKGKATIYAKVDDQKLKTTMEVKTPAITATPYNYNGSICAKLTDGADFPGTVWSSSNTAVATIENGVIIPHATGSFTVTRSINNNPITADFYVSQAQFNDTNTFLVWEKDGDNLITANGLSFASKNYFSYDDFVTAQIGYKQLSATDYNNTVITSGWKSSGQILSPGYVYRLRIKKISDANDPAKLEVSDGAKVRGAVAKVTSINANVYDKIKSVQFDAHRGDTSNAPENTTESFTNAVNSGKYEGIESDVQDTADGQLVMIHDNTLARTTDIASTDPNYSKSINKMTLAEIQNYYIADRVKNDDDVYVTKKQHYLRVPTLDQYLEICKSGNTNGHVMYAKLELKNLKNKDSLQKIYDAIKRHGMEDRTVMISFKPGWMENLRNTVDGASDIPMVPLYSTKLTTEDQDYILHCGFAGVEQKYSESTIEQIQWATNNKLKYLFYSIPSGKYQEAKAALEQYNTIPGIDDVSLDDDDDVDDTDINISPGKEATNQKKSQIESNDSTEAEYGDVEAK